MPSRRCLSADKRLQLIEELWESLDQDDIPLTEEQRAELDRRLAEHEADADEGISWKELKARPLFIAVGSW